MNDAVIVSTVRTPLAKALRGAFNATHAATLGGHVIQHAIARAKIDPRDIDDVIFGCALPEGDAGSNVARQSALRGGVPVTAGAVTIARACSSGLQAICFAAQRIVTDRVPVIVAGGVESVSMVVPTQHRAPGRDPWLSEQVPGLFLSMNETAEVVARRYAVSREKQDAYALESQRRTFAAQQAGRFSAEIVPLRTVMRVTDPQTGHDGHAEVMLEHDECNRPKTTLEGLAKLAPVTGPDGHITAGNASQLADGASACIVAEGAYAARNRLPVLGIYRGFAIAGLAPDEMGIGPIYAVPKLLARHGLDVDDIGLWELNEAYASQVIYCRDRLEIPADRLNVNGGAISIGHPFGMTGARQMGHALIEGARRKVKWIVVTMCVAGGMGAAALFEVA